ncbi:MAG TPA: GTP-binding protein, partial [Deinococcales bacterium]|nr:GTP-binding protein [Deinococcales bacterium]
TTLVNSLINSGAARFGVIVNEFGDVGVDGALIAQVDEDGVRELANGCLCCVAREDLAAAMLTLALRDRPPEWLLIELSGLADPVPVAQTVLEPQLRGLFELDAIVGVADARNLARTLRENVEGAVQLAYASVVLLNKTDLATPDALVEARSLLADLNPLAPVLEAVNASVPSERLMGLRAFAPDWEPAGHHHHHAPDVTTFTLTSRGPLDVNGWNAFLDEFVLSRPESVYRAKGFLRLKGVAHTVLFQAVREVVTAEKGEPQRGLLRQGGSTLVVIGRGLDEQEYRAAFARAERAP